MPDPIFFDGPDGFRDWLDQHHATEPEAIVGFFGKATGRQTMTWSQAVDEALCFGWIDGIVRRIDDERHTRRFTPRKRGSHWSKANVAKVAQLREESRMRPAGEAAFALRTEANTGRASFERDEPAAFTPQQEAALRANANAAAWWNAAPPSYRRTATQWVISAKREETRAKRLASLIACCAAGERVPPLRRLAG